LVAETADLDRHRFGQLTRQVIDMHAGAAVNVRRVLIREEERLHADFLVAAVDKRTRILSARPDKTAN
jgi:hypothetical protein